MSGNRRSSSTPQINHPFLLLIVAIIFLNTGSAFIPSSLRIVSATTTMTTTTTTTGTGGANPTATQTSKPPLLAEVDGGGGGSSNSNDDEDRETSENQDDQPLQLPEATNDPSIPSIKLGGTSCEIFIFHMLINVHPY